MGKDAVVARMKDLGLPFHFAVTATTRPQRPGERDGVDYIFVTQAQFRRMAERGELLEWAEGYGNMYVVPRGQVTQALGNGRDVMVKTDIQGAATIRRLVPDALLVFLAPPSMEDLASRLRERMTESPESLKLRLKVAESEMQEAPRFDHVVVNHQGRLDHTVADLERIVERARVDRGR